MVTLDDLITPREFVELRINHLINDERIEYLGSHAVLTVLVNNKFNASHVPALIVGDGCKDKLDWIVENYDGILRPMGFNGSHVSQIVIGAGWKDKLDWIVENYDGILRPMGFKPTHVARIVHGRDWKDKLCWVEKYSGESSYTPLQIVILMLKKNWKQIVGY
ncbi:hypothetical protein HY483_03515 [Candidatus Woesearchaeota archaeon]|nr:hypothetical protein [Candidatus Woesearchaeota archaeon]